MLTTKLLMKINVEKKPLDLESYDIYGISQQFQAFILLFSDIKLERCDDIEAEYQLKGYQIFHTDLSYTAKGLCYYQLIVAKAGYTF